jgi:RNA polymerase sigma-70 factor (ECF subfamily)
MRPEAVDQIVNLGRDAWPTVEVDGAAFRAWLETRAGDAAQLEALHATDLYLAFACAQGAAGAIRAFEEAHFSDVSVALARIGLGALTDEVSQLLRIKLFFHEPAIAKYSGKVELRAWFRVVAVRTALNLRRGTQREVAMSDQLDDARSLAAADPELLHLKERHQADFIAAFHDAVSEITDKDRNVLYLHYVDRLSIDRIGSIHRVHRATAARWLSRIRDALIERTRALLSERLDLSASELESLLRLLESAVDVDLAQILAPK